MDYESTIKTHSSMLDVDFIDFDGDGRIDRLSPSGVEQDVLSTFDLSDLPTDTATRFFSPLIYREGQFDSKVLSLHGVAIESLQEYLSQMQIYQLHPIQAAIEQTAETYAQSGDAQKYAEYLTENYVPEAHYPMTNPLVAAARAAKQAGLSLDLVHRDVVSGTRNHAESIIETAMTHLTNLRDRKLVVAEAFSILALIDETQIHGRSQQEWEAVFELDERLMKFRAEGLELPFLSTTLIQIRNCKGRVIKGLTKDFEQFSPYTELSDTIVETLRSYSDVLGQNRLSRSVKEAIYSTLSNAIADWYHIQISKALKYAEDPIRSNTPLHWKLLNDGVQSLPEDFFARIQMAYLNQYQRTMASEIKQGLILDLELSRDVKLTMAHMMQGESWLCEAMDREIELRENGAVPKKQIDWQIEIKFFEEQAAKPATSSVTQRYQRLNELIEQS